jgi:hypothetical protein
LARVFFEDLVSSAGSEKNPTIRRDLLQSKQVDRQRKIIPKLQVSGI